MSQAIAKGCDQSGVQIQTRAKCLQCRPDRLVALVFCRLCLQLEHVIQVCCAVQSVREMPPEREPFPLIPPHCQRRAAHPAPHVQVMKINPTQHLLLGLPLALAGSQITGCSCCDPVSWGAPGQVRGGRRRFTWIQS